MTKVRDFRLPDVAEDLRLRVREACPTSIDYRRERQAHLCFALPSETATRKGKRVFFVVTVGKRGGASARPHVSLKALAPTTPVTLETLPELVRVAKQAYDAKSKRAAPTGHQNTESSNVLAGGHFESKRRKF